MEGIKLLCVHGDMVGGVKQTPYFDSHFPGKPGLAISPQFFLLVLEETFGSGFLWTKSPCHGAKSVHAPKENQDGMAVTAVCTWLHL